MARRFGAQHMKNGYAAMGGSLKRPVYGHASGKSVAQAIAQERAAAARQAAIKAGKKK